MTALSSYDLGQYALACRQEQPNLAKATKIQLDTSPVLLVGKQIIIDATGVYPETRVVTAVVGRTVTLSAELTHIHAAGGFVIRLLPSSQLINPIKQIFVAAVNAINVTDDVAAPNTPVNFPNSHLYACGGGIRIPENYNGSFTFSVVVEPAAVGDLYDKVIIFVGALGESFSTHTTIIDFHATTVEANRIQKIHDTVIAAAAGEYVNVVYYRNALNAGDTVEDVCAVLGFLLVYIDPT